MVKTTSCIPLILSLYFSWESYIKLGSKARFVLTDPRTKLLSFSLRRQFEWRVWQNAFVLNHSINAESPFKVYGLNKKHPKSQTCRQRGPYPHLPPTSSINVLGVNKRKLPRRGRCPFLGDVVRSCRKIRSLLVKIFSISSLKTSTATQSLQNNKSRIQNFANIYA